MKGILLASYIENITTRKDNTLKVVLGTQEISSDKAGELFSLMNKLSCVYISKKDDVNEDEINEVDSIDIEFPTKSQSQRIRNTLHVLFKQKPEGYTTFDSYYKSKTEKYIEHLKSKINP